MHGFYITDYMETDRTPQVKQTSIFSRTRASATSRGGLLHVGRVAVRLICPRGMRACRRDSMDCLTLESATSLPDTVSLPEHWLNAGNIGVL